MELLGINGKPDQEARLLDLSTNGAKLALPFSPPLMAQMTISFLLPGLDQPTEIKGRVVWKKPVNSEKLYVVGFQFYQNYWEIDRWLRQQN